MRIIDAGIYTISEGAKLLRLPPRRLRGWVTGHAKTKGPPLIQSELERLDGRVAVSFVNLMEARFIDRFVRAGVHPTSLRIMAREARRFFEHPHPFATNVIFRTDGKKIFAEVAKQTDDRALYDLRAKNWAFHEVIAQSLMEGVEYAPSGDPRFWRPRPTEAPNVIVHPKMAFGRPVLRHSGVPTRALYDAFRAEGETYGSLSRWFDVPEAEAREAVHFEADLAMAA